MSIDTFEFDYGQWLIRLSTDYDTTITSPRAEYGDDGAYGEAQEKAFQNQEWSFMVLKVEAILDDMVFGTAYLGGVESGYIPDDDGNEQKFLQSRGTTLYTTGYYDPTQDVVNYHDTVEEAVREATEKLQEVVASLPPMEIKSSGTVCVDCAARGTFTWLNEDGTCRRADKH
jgi:hypothetical protein